MSTLYGVMDFVARPVTSIRDMIKKADQKAGDGTWLAHAKNITNGTQTGLDISA